MQRERCGGKALRDTLLERRLAAKIDVVEMKETGCQGSVNVARC